MANSVLPYWDQNIDLDIAPWVPYGKDYSPVTVNSLCNPTLGGLAGLALEMKSEFLYMRSFQNGSIGTMARQNIIDPVRNSSIELGFTMVFAYSEQLEQSVLRLLHKYPGLMAGLTLCDIWRENVLVDECKVLMLVDEENLSFFAEKFGYKRFSISYETDDLLQMRITQALFDLELDATKEVVGPVPELKVPPMPSLK